jgi:hypothetical protein
MVEIHPETRLIGYARVSTYGQTLDSQLEQLRAAGCSSRNIYREKVTGLIVNSLVRVSIHVIPRLRQWQYRGRRKRRKTPNDASLHLADPTR